MPPSARRADSARAALTLLGLAVVFAAALMSATPATHSASPPPPGRSDVATFRAIVSRLRMGEPYYSTVGDELRRGDYPTAHAFNWRTPLLFTTLSGVSDQVGQATWIALAIVLCCVTFAMLLQPPLPVVVTATFMQAGAVAAMDPFAGVVMGEAWAGALIALSVCAYARGYAGLGMPLGLLALFVRELAAPYCVICTLIALAKRRWREVALWLAAACVYGAFYAWHLSNVWGQQRATDVAHSLSWVQFSGLSFLLLTIRFHRLLHVAPAFVVALGLTLIVAGTVGRSTPLHVRLTSAVYLIFFLVAGQVFNDYWGLIAWPTWALASGFGIRTLIDSINDVRRLPSRPGEAGIG